MVNVLKKHSQAFSIHFTTYADIPVDSFCIPLQNPAPILSILQKAELAYKTGDELTILSYLYLLCAKFERILEKQHSWTDRRITTAKKYMDFHFQEKNCLHMAIAESSLGERRFQDLFRESFHTTANRYIIEKKVAYAKDLLSVGGLQIAEIAQLCGFSDVYYFSKVFKQETGISPGKWKKMQG